MKSRQRILAALNHRQPDRIPVDLGGTWATGIAGRPWKEFSQHLGLACGLPRIDPGSGIVFDIGEDMRKAVGADAVPVSVEHAHPGGWKIWKRPDGSVYEVPDDFSPRVEEGGTCILEDDHGHVTGILAASANQFMWTYHPLATAERPADIEVFDWDSLLYDRDDLVRLSTMVRRVAQADYAVVAANTECIYELAQGLRGWINFMVDMSTNPAMAEAILGRVVEIQMRRFDQYIDAAGDTLDVVCVADDMGMQTGLQISPRLYRQMIKPKQRRFYEHIKSRTRAKLLLHSCGSVLELIPDFIEIGVDALNPVQVSARGMDTRELKRRFGTDICFWGGGCDTQRVLPRGTVREVEDEVRRRIEDLAPGGGFVFTPVLDIQADVPPRNIAAMYQALDDYCA